MVHSREQKQAGSAQVKTKEPLVGVVAKYDKFGSGIIEADGGAQYFFRIANLSEQVRGMRVLFEVGKPAKGKKLAEATQVRACSGDALPMRPVVRPRRYEAEDAEQPQVPTAPEPKRGELAGRVVSVQNARQFAHARIEGFDAGDVFLHFRRARGQPHVKEGDLVFMRVLQGDKGPMAEYWYKPGDE